MEKQNNHRQFISNNYAEAEKLKYTPVEPGSTTYFYDVFKEDTFDVKPMLKYLNAQDGQQLLKYLHFAIDDLLDYYLEGDGKDVVYSRMVLHTFRNLEAALLSGFRLVDLDKSYATDENQKPAA